MAATNKCDICHYETDTYSDTAKFGDWISSKRVTVHYFCLLLSTNLQQRGEICNKFLGFLLSDIRAEIKAAAKRECCYCEETQASIACHICKEYFHIVCGDENHCLFTFHDEFLSYCDKCCLKILPTKDPAAVSSNVHHSCYICHVAIGERYSPVKWISAPCCGNGYVHQLCMLKYARSAGYYLKCIWCGDKSFREKIRSQGIFVPDCDASWEKQKHLFGDLYRGHKRCDIEPCLCPRGRDFMSGKWSIILCSMCGSFGAHNPICVSGNAKNQEKVDSFKCNTCAVVERDMMLLHQKRNAITSPRTTKSIDTSMYVPKRSPGGFQEALIAETATVSFSDDGSFASTSSATTVIPNHRVSITEKTNDIPSKITKIDLNTPNISDDEDVVDLNTQPNDDLNETNMETLSPTQDMVSATPAAVNTLTHSQTVASTSQEHVEDNIIILHTHEIDDSKNCVGTRKIRINMSEPRFANQTMDEIENSKDLITEDDIIESSPDRGIFDILDAIIAEYNEEFKNLLTTTPFEKMK